MLPFAGMPAGGKLLQDRAIEVAALKRRIAQLTAEARRNVRAWERLQHLELGLLESDGLPALFSRLTTELRRAFSLQATSVALADPDRGLRNLLLAQGEEPERFQHLRFVDTIDGLVPELKGLTKPWLGELNASARRKLFAGSGRIASVALLPMVRHGRTIGSLHFGSEDSGRFTPAHAADFLHHLASVAAVAVESAVNRARLIQRGFTDALTSWHNRAYLDTRLVEEVVRSQREQSSLVCLLLDIDHFKRVNDEHGHVTGDAVLREVADRVGAEVRRSDISARYGGEEFVVLLPRTGIEVGQRLAERVLGAVSERPFGVDVLARPLPVTVSIGLAEFRPDIHREKPEIAARQLLARADEALYGAKTGGRNQVVLAAA
jgi:diguanylate cyclase (GGDEF)-like protein